MRFFFSPLCVLSLAALAAAPAAGQTRIELRGDLGPVKRPLAAAAPVASAADARAADPAVGRWVVQVFCTPYAREARQVARRLNGQGYAAQIESHRLGEMTLHRVRLGPLDRKDEAERLAGAIRDRYKLDAWITN